ncbi:MAG TPA: zf-HC2 domain-containing protein [Thermoanaerobaculia bacterium]|nr:zf-HC2 domain-containing protein [Thermoanaerobaculia bacterium]
MSDDSRHLLEELEALAAARHAFEGDHPSPELIEEHVLGTVSPELAQTVAAHLATCPECADLARDLADFPNLEVPAGQRPLTAAELAGDWARLQSKVALEPPTSLGGRAAVIPFPSAGEVEPRRLKGQVALWRTAAVLAVLVAGVLGLRQPNPQASRVFVDPDIVDLYAETDFLRGAPGRGAGTEVKVVDTDSFLLILHLPSQPPGDFGVLIEAVDGNARAPRKVMERGGLHLQSGRATLTLQLDRTQLSPGHYRVLLSVKNGGKEAPLAVYSVRVAD